MNEKRVSFLFESWMVIYNVKDDIVLEGVGSSVYFKGRIDSIFWKVLRFFRMCMIFISGYIILNVIVKLAFIFFIWKRILKSYIS